MSRPFGHPRGGVASVAMPTTSLYAQFDANDVAAHTPGSGLWAPSAGSDSTPLLTQNAAGTTGVSFGYGTAQNGLQTVDTAGALSFIAQTTSATTYADVIVLFALRNHGSYFTNFQKTDTSANLAVVDSATIKVQDGNGNNQNLIKTGIGSAGTFSVFGFCWSGTLGRIVMLSTGLFSESWSNQFLTADVQPVGLRHANTRWIGIGTTVLGDAEVGEILVYTTADLGQALQAMQYLKDRWRITT